MAGLTSIDRVSASDPKSALALQKLVQAAVRLPHKVLHEFGNVFNT